MSYIRISRTQEVDQALHALKTRYAVLSEAEIIKLLISDAYLNFISSSSYHSLSDKEEEDLEYTRKHTSSTKPMSAAQTIKWLEE